MSDPTPPDAQGPATAREMEPGFAMGMRVGPTTGSTVHRIRAEVKDAGMLTERHGVQFQPDLVSAIWVWHIGSGQERGWIFNGAVATGEDSTGQLHQLRWTDVAECPEWVRGWMWLCCGGTGIEIPGFSNEVDDDD